MALVRVPRQRLDALFGRADRRGRLCFCRSEEPIRRPGAAALIVILAFGLLTATLTADAQQAGRGFRIGILASSPPTTPGVSGVWDAFIHGLRELGYVEGQNITIERRFSEGKAERLPDLAAELVRLNVEVIVAAGTPPAAAAKHATRTIPIVMTNVNDPVGLGLVASLARPGGNITGLSILTIELIGKQLQLLKQAVPKASRVAYLVNPSSPGAELALREAETAARSPVVKLQILKAQGPDELDKAFAAMTRLKFLRVGNEMPL